MSLLSIRSHTTGFLDFWMLELLDFAKLFIWQNTYSSTYFVPIPNDRQQDAVPEEDISFFTYNFLLFKKAIIRIVYIMQEDQNFFPHFSLHYHQILFFNSDFLAICPHFAVVAALDATTKKLVISIAALLRRCCCFCCDAVVVDSAIQRFIFLLIVRFSDSY